MAGEVDYSKHQAMSQYSTLECHFELHSEPHLQPFHSSLHPVPNPSPSTFQPTLEIASDFFLRPSARSRSCRSASWSTSFSTLVLFKRFTIALSRVLILTAH